MIPVMIPLSFPFKSKINGHKLINKLNGFLFCSSDKAQAIGGPQYLTVKERVGGTVESQKHGSFVAIRKEKKGRE